MTTKEYIRSELNKGQVVSFFMFHENKEYVDTIHEIIQEAIALSDIEEQKERDRHTHLEASRQKRIDRVLAQRDPNATE